MKNAKKNALFTSPPNENDQKKAPFKSSPNEDGVVVLNSSDDYFDDNKA